MTDYYKSRSAVLAFGLVLPESVNIKQAGWFKSDKPPEFWVSVLAQRSAGVSPGDSLSAVPEEDSSGASGSAYVEVWRSPRQIARATGGGSSNGSVGSSSSSSSGGGSGARFALWAAPCFLPELGRGASADTAYYIAVCWGAPPKDKDGQGGFSSLKPVPPAASAAPGGNNGGGGDCSGPVPSGLPSGCIGWCRVAHWALVAGEGSPSVLGLALTKEAGGGKHGDSGRSGACVAVWRLPKDPFTIARDYLGGLAAAPNPQNPFHHAYVYAKRPQPGDLSLPHSPSFVNVSLDGKTDLSVGARVPRPKLLLATESTIEVGPCFKLPSLLLEPVVTSLEQCANAWEARKGLEAMAQGITAMGQPVIGGGSGYVSLRVTIARCRNLPVLPGGAFVVAAEEGGRAGDHKAALVDYPSTHVEVLYDSPTSRLHALTLGRTNTEYEAQSPLYGTNAHQHKCPHKDPETAYQAAHASVAVVDSASANVSQEVVTYYTAASGGSGDAELNWTANDGRHPGHACAEKVPQPTTLVVQVPRYELHSAFLHFRVIEERVMKGKDNKRCEAFQCSSVLRVAVPKALQYSEPPSAAVAAAAAAGRGSGNSLSSEDVCSCWYPLKGVNNGDDGAEILVAVSLAELEEDEGNASSGHVPGGNNGNESFDRDALARNVGNRASAVRVSHGTGGAPPSPGGGGGSESGEESGDEEDDEVRKAAAALSDAANTKMASNSSNSKDRLAQQKVYAESSLATATGCNQSLNLLGVPPNPLTVCAARDATRFGATNASALAYPQSASDEAPLPLTAVATQAAIASSSSSSSSSVAGAHVPSRLLPVDWSLRWIDRHVQYLRRDLAILSRSASMTDSLHQRGRCFRGSKLKKTIELQGVSMNLHCQLFRVEECDPSGLPYSAEHPNRRVGEYDFVTHGAPTVHAFGFGRGGLHALEKALSATGAALEQKLSAYVRARDQHLAQLPAMLAQRKEEEDDHKQTSTMALAPDSEASLLLQEVGRLSMQYEGRAAEVSIRRALAVAQGLGIVYASFAQKLMLLLHADGAGPLAAVPTWCSAGYLVYLEGLITTAGKELGMMQDVDSVVELLKQWTIRIQPLGANAAAAASSADGKSAARGVVDVSANPEARELHVLLDAASFQRLPACLQEPNLAIQLVPVLFVQGVDIKQSLSNRSGEKEGSGPRFQMSLNRKYFQLVNAYAHASFSGQAKCASALAAAEAATRAAAVDADGDGEPDALDDLSSVEVHPLCETLAHAVKGESPKEKNVEILEEASRVVHLLGGGVCVFCKSGKDRTAMAVTLHQAKVLGERHGLSTSSGSMLEAAGLMRGAGTRIDVANKNIGAYKYSFNPLQVSYLPAEWKPPAYTVQGFLTSVLKRDS